MTTLNFKPLHNENYLSALLMVLSDNPFHNLASIDDSVKT